MRTDGLTWRYDYIVPWKRHRRHGAFLIGHHIGDCKPYVFRVENKEDSVNTSSAEYVPPIPPLSPYRKLMGETPPSKRFERK